jgi:hypothetical protein
VVYLLFGVCSRVGSAMPAYVVQKIQGKYKKAYNKTRARDTEIAEAHSYHRTTEQSYVDLWILNIYINLFKKNIYIYLLKNENIGADRDPKPTRSSAPATNKNVSIFHIILRKCD